VRVSWVIVFFFSSRRRHTRLVSDWSSDVCSSDLERAIGFGTARLAEIQAAEQFADNQHICALNYISLERRRFGQRRKQSRRPQRSEERRVGKEGRSRRGEET